MLELQEVLEAAECDDGRGFCTACGEEHYSCEPDARQYECHYCGLKSVYGAAEILLMGLWL